MSSSVVTFRGTRHLTLVAVVLAVALPLLIAPPLPADASEIDTASETCLVDHINASRAAEGLAPLTVVTSMVGPSRTHTAAMISAGRLFHPSSSEILTGAPTPWSSWGENVGYARDCHRLHTNFMNSPGHRNNIMRAATNGVAVGARRSGSSVWVTVRFITSPSIVPPADQPVGTFTDVPPGSTFHADIERLHEAGITKGCNPPANSRYCPDRTLTRGEMAAFLARALDLPRALDAGFDDVPPSHLFAADVATLAAAGITKGCDPPGNRHYCPDRTLTRGEMAAFLTRALDLSSAPHAGFVDVPRHHPFAPDIAALAAADIARGCDPPDNRSFCPGRALTRGELAALIVRAGLPD